MTYRVNTITSTIKYPVLFKCEKCGKYTLALNPFSVSSSYNDKGALTQKSIQRRENQAYDELSEKQNALYGDIITKTCNRKVKDLGYVCTCSNCNATPKWSQIHNKGLDKLFEVSIVLSVISAAIISLAVMDFGSSHLIYYLISAGILALGIIPRHLIYSAKMRKVKEMDEEYMPKVFENIDEAIEKALELDRDIKLPELPQKPFYMR